MTLTTTDAIAAMKKSLVGTTGPTLARVHRATARELGERLRELRISADHVDEITRHWDDFRGDPQWSDLLASTLATVAIARGDCDAPIPIWPDFPADDRLGRYFFFYLFALDAPAARDYLDGAGFPREVVERSFDVLARHCATHLRKWGVIGVDAGWWMLPVLRGELVQVGSLQYHRVNLGVGSLSPSPWYSAQESAELGVGFRHGDPSIGLHIPQRTDFAPRDLDRSIAEARELLGEVWPVGQRRLATCQTWMLDDRLGQYLAPTSNIVAFQSRFTLLARWQEDDEDVLEFVFRRPNTGLDDLPQTTSLERAVVRVLREGQHWRNRTGWFDFD